MQILTRIREMEARGESVVSMVVGEPDFPTPDPIVRAARSSLETKRNRYTPSLGLDSLRARISDWYRDRYRVQVAPERIAVTTGASGALTLVCAALVPEGGEVLVTDPGYACNRHFVRVMGGRAVGIGVDARTDFHPTAAQIAEHWTSRTVAVLITSPANPTGTLIDPSELAAILEVVRARGGTLIVDEVYQELVYDTAPRTALELGDDIVVVGSFSKYWSMTGWRVGWLAGPPSLVRAIDRLAQHLYVSSPDLAQQAALAAFEPETLAICEGYRRRFQAQRDLLLPELHRLGFGVSAQPRGAFHVYVDCSAFTDDSRAFCWEVLEGARVALTPGCDFGEHRPDQHLRVSYPKPVEVLSEGIARLEAFLARRSGR